MLMHGAMVLIGVAGTLLGWTEMALTVGTFVAAGLYATFNYLLVAKRLPFLSSIQS
ncbi:hypothetical protein HML84_00950 [Alcanivorax sp. IO_7]|nr:hypothetical protein HML84_00950 [Alcanivorax sp. IO_7]